MDVSPQIRVWRITEKQLFGESCRDTRSREFMIQNQSAVSGSNGFPTGASFPPVAKPIHGGLFECTRIVAFCRRDTAQMVCRHLLHHVQLCRVVWHVQTAFLATTASRKRIYRNSSSFRVGTNS